MITLRLILKVKLLRFLSGLMFKLSWLLDKLVACSNAFLPQVEKLEYLIALSLSTSLLKTLFLLILKGFKLFLMDILIFLTESLMLTLAKASKARDKLESEVIAKFDN